MTKHEPARQSPASAEELTQVPSGFRPWRDSTRTAEERFEAYKEHVREQVLALNRAVQKLESSEELRQLIDSPKTQRFLNYAEELAGMTVAEYSQRFEVGLDLWKLLGRNFLGAGEWRGAFEVDVGSVPPIPSSITPGLLESLCPLHPGEKIKETHLLVLMPKTVDDEPYTALKLHELCAGRKGSGERLIWDQEKSWNSRPWASSPQSASEWVLIAKSDPDRRRVSADKHFRDKNLAEQQKVHDQHYKEYREAKAIELMTAVLLNDLVNGEPRMLTGGGVLRCAELNSSGGRLTIGDFDARGLCLGDYDLDYGSRTNGLALARKS